MQPIRAQIHAPAAYAERITHLVRLAGLRPTPRADVALLVTERDDASSTDHWLVDSLPHLVLRLGRDAIRLGPFVQPGVTACFRCAQVGGLEEVAALTTDDEPDPALLMVGLGWAARDLTAWRSRKIPATWSSSVTLRADLQAGVKRWPRHAHCGCWWGLPDHLTG